MHAYPGPASPLARVAAMRIAMTAALVLLLGAGPAAAPLPVQLVETIPVETRLGDPSLPQAAKVWVEMIEGARRSIDLEHFYLSHWPGEPTGPVLDALGRAAKRGVQVRLILDVRFQATYPEPADSIGKLPGVALRWIDMKKISGGGVQHAKIMLVDDAQVFVGSQNFDWRALEHIHEMGVRVRDPRIAGLFRRVFEYDWAASAPGAAPPAPGSMGTLERAVFATLPLPLVQGPGDTVRVWPSFSPRDHIPDPALWDRDQIVRLLDGARSEVVVQLLTYGLGRGSERDSTLDQALRRAAARGVRVRLLVSDWEADSPRIADLQRLTTVANVEVRLSSVPEWSGGYIPFARVEHCKYMVADSSWLWLGTSNWEPSYFLASRNLAVTVHHAPLARRARGIFETSWNAPSATAFNAGVTLAKRVHGETPPPGATFYGE